MLDVLVFDVDLKRVPVLIVLAAVRTSYCLLCTRVYVLHVANKVLCRDIFITSLTVDLTCNLIKAHSWSRTIDIVNHSQVLLTGGVVFENLLAHWTFDLIVRSMHISCVPWVVLCINVLIAVSTENCPCKKLRVTMHSNKKSNSSRRGSTFIEISSYHWLAIWYKLCRTRMCFLQEASFLNTFWQTWHWTSVLLWTSRMCLRKFTTILSHISHQLFLPKMTNRIEQSNRNASLTKPLICRQRHKALPPVCVEGGLVTKCALTRRALQVLGLCVDFAQVTLHAPRVQEFEADIALNLPFPTGACEPT